MDIKSKIHKLFLVKNNQVEDAIEVLTLLIAELKMSYVVIDLFLKRVISDETFEEKKLNVGVYLGIQFNYIIITLTKYLELYQKYKHVINRVSGNDGKDLFQSLNRLSITEYRNKYCAHIIDKSTGRPISHEESNKFFENINNSNKSLQDFIMKVDKYDFINGETITERLGKIKKKLIDFRANAG